MKNVRLEEDMTENMLSDRLFRMMEAPRRKASLSSFRLSFDMHRTGVGMVGYSSGAGCLPISDLISINCGNVSSGSN